MILKLNIHSSSPVKLLIAMNVLKAVFGLIVNSFVAKSLGLENLGVIAVIASAITTCVAFVDVGFLNIVIKEYSSVSLSKEKSAPNLIAAILWIGVLSAFLTGLVAFFLVVIFGPFILVFLTETPVAKWWIVVLAFSQMIQITSDSCIYLLRLSQDFFRIAIVRFLNCLIVWLFTIIIISKHPSISGFCVASLVNSCTSLCVLLLLFFNVWSTRRNIPLFQPSWERGLKTFKSNLKTVWYGNLISYSKLFQRGVDVLFLAKFSNDRETGLYKFCRQLVDPALSIIYEAVIDVYQPKFLKIISAKSFVLFRSMARRIIRMSLLLTIVLIVFEIFFLDHCLSYFFPPDFVNSTFPIMILSVTLIFLVGFYPWQWPLFLSHESLFYYSNATFFSVITQYGFSALLFFHFGATALTMSMGVLSYYLFLTPYLCWITIDKWPSYFPLFCEHSLILDSGKKRE